MRFIIQSNNTADSKLLGGKAYSLALLGKAGFPIPPWFVMSPRAFQESLTNDQKDTLSNAQNSEEIKAILLHIHMNPRVQDELMNALKDLCTVGEYVAVRSSALDEDMPLHSFAGQLESYLFVPLTNVVNRILDVWRSGYAERVLKYRKERGLPLVPKPPAVIVQKMVNADASGVAFSVDPVSGDEKIAVVSAVYGLGSLLVSGESDADTYFLDNEGRIIKRNVAEKKIAHRLSPTAPEGPSIVSIPAEDANRNVLIDGQVQVIHQLVKKAEQFFRKPQDIEWAIEKGNVFLLQSRPITTLSGSRGELHRGTIWDNSNIAESFGGITTPLTFSLAESAYEKVYQQFCRIMGVPKSTVRKNKAVFQNMLGHIQGRVYYNLLNWYRVLAMLPGFQINRHFMEQMMGVKEKLPDVYLREFTHPTWRDHFLDFFRIARTLIGLVLNHTLLEKRMRHFLGRLQHALGIRPPNLRSYSTEQLVAYYRTLEAELLAKWDSPIVNDFFAMIYFGVLRRLTAKWCDDSAQTLQNDLLCGEGGMISTEPAKRIKEMAVYAAESPRFVEALKQGSKETTMKEMENQTGVRDLYHAYMEKFGDRCMDELKLESPTLQDNPEVLFRSIGQIAQQLRNSKQSGQKENPVDKSLRRAAEVRVGYALSGKPFRRTIFNWVLKNARARIRDRENLRFERTRVFGRARMIFVALGQRYAEAKQIDNPGDIFHLTVEEALGIASGAFIKEDLWRLIKERKLKFSEYTLMPAPPSRFETYDPYDNDYVPVQPEQNKVAPDQGFRHGIGCCPGKVSGEVVIITNPNDGKAEMGKIFVTERTDPSWIVIFPLAKGLLIERGSLLSHAAIVSREMGIPTVVAVHDIMRWLKDGDWVEFDGSTGIIKKLR